MVVKLRDFSRAIVCREGVCVVEWLCCSGCARTIISQLK